MDDSHIMAFAQSTHRLMVLLAPTYDDEAMLMLFSDMIESKKTNDGSGVSLDALMAEATELAVVLEQARTSE